jgi:scyllo-inositol 2-dehydrogenase (NADP+)
MESSPLRVGVIGYGLAGSAFHAPLISVTPGLSLAAIVTRDAERRAKARADYPSVKLLEAAEALFAEPQIDIAVIATPNSTHVPFARAALQAGKHVVIDKPAAPTSADVEGLMKLAQQHRRVLTIYQNRRWDGDFLTVRQMVQQGLLGEVFSYESHFDRYRATPNKNAWREQESEAGGLLYDLGAHLIDQALQLFGPAERVYAEVERRRAGVTVDDVVFVGLTHKNGVRSHLHATVLARILGPRFHVRGLLGTYEKYGLDPQEDALRAGLRPGASAWGAEPRSAWGQLSTSVGGLHMDGPVETLPGCYQRFYELLRDAVAQGGPPPVDPADAIASLRVIEAAFKSAQTGEVVRLG